MAVDDNSFTFCQRLWDVVDDHFRNERLDQLHRVLRITKHITLLDSRHIKVRRQLDPDINDCARQYLLFTLTLLLHGSNLHQHILRHQHHFILLFEHAGLYFSKDAVADERALRLGAVLTDGGTQWLGVIPGRQSQLIEYFQ